MDLSTHAAVIRRHWKIAVAGLLLGVALAAFAIARPSMASGKPTLTYRKSEVWQSNSTLLLTQSGFQEGKLNTSADPNRLSSLAVLYAQLATGDEMVRRLHLGPGEGGIQASAELSASQSPTPLLDIFGQATTPAKAVALTKRASAAFLSYIEKRQAEAGIRAGDRVHLSVIRDSVPPILIQPRHRTVAFIVFLATLSAAFGLIYVLEASRKRREVAPVTTTLAERPAAPAQQVVTPVPQTRTVAEEPAVVAAAPDVDQREDDELESAVASRRRWA